MTEPYFSSPNPSRFNEATLARGAPRQVISACSDLIDGNTLDRIDLAVVFNKRANAYAAMRNHDRAYEDYAAALKIDPNYAAAYFNRAVLNFNRKRYEEALEDFTVAISIDRNVAENYRGRGRVLERLERYREAAADYTRALQIDRNDPVTLYRRGRSLELQGRKKGAIDDFVAALALNQEFEPARVALNRVKSRSASDNTGARRGARVSGHSDTRQGNMGQAEAEQAVPQMPTPEQVIDASVQFERKESRDRADKASAYAEQGINQRRAGNHILAIEDFNQSLALNPRSAETFWQRAVTFRMLRRYEAAIDDYTSALELDPDYADAYSGRAWSLYKSGRFDAALSDVDRALELKPKEAIFHDTRGHIYEALNLLTAAIASFRNALQLDSDLITSRKALERLDADFESE